MPELIPVRYVGRKPFAVDNVAHSGKLWKGRGDVQSVTEAQAKVLTKYPDQWALVSAQDEQRVIHSGTVEVDMGEGETTEIQADALHGVPLEKMSKPELLAYALAHFGKTLDGRKSAKNLIDQIEELQADPSVV